MNVYSMPGFLSLPAHVEGCKWTWKFTYSGTYPNPKGFWTFYEDATVADGTLEVVTTYGHELELKGEGTVDVSVDQNGSDESTTCALDQPPEGSASVQVTGRLDQPMPGMMQVHFSFDPVNLSGGGKFHCQVIDSQNIIPFALPSTTFDVNALSLSSVVVSTNSDSLSWPVPQAILWELPGSGSFQFKFTRVSR